MSVGVQNYNYRANHFTGANVSIMIGPQLVTQCFGISWNIHQNKRPIYGYNSQYFDAVADGTVMVTGQIFINFVHPNYLPTLMQRYYSFLDGAKRIVESGTGSELISYLNNNQSLRPLIDIIRTNLDPRLGVGEVDAEGRANVDRLTYEYTNILDQQTPYSTLDMSTRITRDEQADPYPGTLEGQNERIRSVDAALNIVFEDESVRQDMISFFTGGINTGTSIMQGETTQTITTGLFTADTLESVVENNQPRNNLSSEAMIFARPDQFGSGSSSPHGLDIMVHFGPPYGLGEQNQILNYSEQASFMLRDIHFMGEASDVMMNDQPVMEVYSFIARKKESITREEYQQ